MSSALRSPLRSGLRAVVSDVDAGWLEAALARDGAALRATCRAVTDDPGEADDLLQETLVRALAAPPADRSAPVLPWLRTVARNLAHDRRKRLRPVPVEDPDAAPDPGEGPERAEAADAVAEALVRAVATLGTAQLAVWLLQTFLGLEADDVAALVGATPGNVRVLAHRARSALREPVGAPARAVSDFLELVCSERIFTLADLVRHARPGGAVPGELGSALHGRAAADAWSRLVAAAGAVAGDAAPAALWSRAAALEEAGRLDESREAWAHALEASRARGDDGAATRALVGLARGALHRGDTAAYDALAAEAAPPEPADALERATLDASRRWRAGDHAGAAAVYERLLAEVDDPEARAALLHNLALVGAYAGRLDDARARATEALALHRAAGNAPSEARTLNALGMAAQNAGALAEADRHFRAALAAAAALGPEHRVAPTTNLGLLAQERGDTEGALARYAEARALATEARSARSLAIAWANAGVALHADGRRLRAREAFQRAGEALGDADFADLRAFVALHAAVVDAPDAPGRALSRLREVAPPDAALVALRDVLAGYAAACADGPGALDPALDAAAPHRDRSVVVRLGVDLVRRRVLARLGAPERAR